MELTLLVWFYLLPFWSFYNINVDPSSMPAEMPTAGEPEEPMLPLLSWIDTGDEPAMEQTWHMTWILKSTDKFTFNSHLSHLSPKKCLIWSMSYFWICANIIYIYLLIYSSSTSPKIKKYVWLSPQLFGIVVGCQTVSLFFTPPARVLLNPRPVGMKTSQFLHKSTRIFVDGLNLHVYGWSPILVRKKTRFFSLNPVVFWKFQWIEFVKICPWIAHLSKNKLEKTLSDLPRIMQEKLLFAHWPHSYPYSYGWFMLI